MSTAIRMKVIMPITIINMVCDAMMTLPRAAPVVLNAAGSTPEGMNRVRPNSRAV